MADWQRRRGRMGWTKRGLRRTMRWPTGRDGWPANGRTPGHRRDGAARNLERQRAQQGGGRGGGSVEERRVVGARAGPGGFQKRTVEDGGGQLSGWRERSVEQRWRDRKPPTGYCCGGVLSAPPETLPSGPVGTLLWDWLLPRQDPDRCRIVSLLCTARGASNEAKNIRRQ